MIDITKPITKKEFDDEFLRKLFILCKTVGPRDNYGVIKDFICDAFKMAGEIPPSDIELEPFELED